MAESISINNPFSVNSLENNLSWIKTWFPIVCNPERPIYTDNDRPKIN